MAGKNPLDALNASAEEEEKKAQEATKAFAAQMAAANKPVAQPTPAPQAPVAYRTETYTDPNFGDTGGASGIGKPQIVKAGLDARDRGGQQPVSDLTGGGTTSGNGPGFTGEDEYFPGQAGAPRQYVPPAIKPATSGNGTGAAGVTKPPATAQDSGANIVSPANSGGGGGRGGGGGAPPPPPKVMPYEGPYIKQGAAWDDAKTQAYYKANPDVAKAVAAGKMEDAQSHYEKHGKAEGRSFAEAAAAQVPVAKANNDKLQAELDALRAEKAKADVEKKNADGRAAAVAELTPRIKGVDQWGAQLVDFGGGNPKGVTLTDAELRGIASKAGYGYETVAQAWKNAGGKVGDDKSWAGMLDLPKTPAAGAEAAPFDSATYLKNNPDVAAAIANGTFKGTAQDHYDQFGKKEVRPGGREATAGEMEAAAAAKTFDSAKYLADNPDVAKAIANGTFRGNAFDHYWQLGRNEVRPGGRAFTAAELAERATWPTAPATPPTTPSTPSTPPTTVPPTTPSTPPTAPKDTAPPPATMPPDEDPNKLIDYYPPMTGPVVQAPQFPPGTPNAQPTPPAPSYPVFTPQRSPGDYRGIRPPEQGDLDGNGNIWSAERGGGGRWVPYTPPTPPPPAPPAYVPIAPTDFTGRNADSNIVAAGKFIETLPGGADVWEYNDIENVVANRWTGERRPIPPASVPPANSGNGPRMSIGGIGTMPEPRMSIGGINTMPFNPNTGLPYTPADFIPNPQLSIGGVNTMPEQRMSIGGVNTMPINPRTGLPYTPASDYMPQSQIAAALTQKYGNNPVMWPDNLDKLSAQYGPDPAKWP